MLHTDTHPNQQINPLTKRQSRDINAPSSHVSTDEVLDLASLELLQVRFTLGRLAVAVQADARELGTI